VPCSPDPALLSGGLTQPSAAAAAPLPSQGPCASPPSTSHHCHTSPLLGDSRLPFSSQLSPLRRLGPAWLPPATQPTSATTLPTAEGQGRGLLLLYPGQPLAVSWKVTSAPRRPCAPRSHPGAAMVSAV